MKRQGFYVRRYQNSSRPWLQWQVTGPKRRRKFFRMFNDAKTYAHLRNTELSRYGSETPQLTGWELHVARRCLDDLAPYNVTLEEATRMVIEQEKVRRKSSAIESVCEQFLDSLISRRIKRWSLNAYRRMAKRLCHAFPGKLISDFTTRELEDFLRTIGQNWSASSRNQHRGQLASLWSYGDKHGYCSEKVARNIEWLTPVETTIGTLSPSEIARLVAAAPPKLLPGLAIGAWAGLRVSEICRLDWSEIDLRDEPDRETGGYGFIHVMPEKAKTARNRFVTILPTLAAWLRPFQKVSGKVIVAGDTQYFDEVRQNIALQVGITNWPANALRHSYASYHYAHFRKLGDLVVEMGHTGSRQIFAHYRALIKPEAAAEYWGIIPFSRPEIASIHAFTPEAYNWCRRVNRVIDGDWINGVKNLAHFFGCDDALPYWWFNHVPDVPPRPSDDRFHIPTWLAFVKRHRHWKSNNFDCSQLFYVSWYRGDRSGEQREYFATEAQAVEFAAARNREMLAEELRLEEIQNVIEFPKKSLSADTVQLPLQLPTSESARSAG